MKQKFKIAFFDIDWTLFDHKKREWSRSALEAIKGLQKEGVKIILCTSRPVHSMAFFGVFNLGIEWNGVIASAGAVVYCEGKCLRKTLMDKEPIISFINECDKKGLTLELVEPLNRTMPLPPNIYSNNFYLGYHESLPCFGPYEGQEVVGLNFFAPKEFDEEFSSKFPGLIYTRYFDYAVDVMGERHEKGDGVNTVLRYYGLHKEDSISFGDDIQDVSMGQATEAFVCMGQGHEKAKKAASFISSSVGEDGVYKGLVHYGLVK